MADGRTPTMTISGQSQTVTLEDVRSAFPFPAIAIQRSYQERQTRDSSTGAGKTKRVYRSYSNAEESIQVQVPYLHPDNYAKLRTMIEADPPTVSVTYLHLTTQSFDLVELTPTPNDFRWVDDPSYSVTLTLLRNSA